MVPPAQSLHPSREQLTAFVKGTLTDADDEIVEAHVAACTACTQTLSALSDDTIVGLLRANDLSRAPTWQEATLAATGESTTQVDESQRNAVAPPAELANHTKFQVMDLLGQGGMGRVYKAQHRMMNRPVALKVINQDLVRNAAAVARFHREVQAAARLSHPNIVAAYDAEQSGNVHFLVMEYVDGVDLAEVVRTRGPLPVHEACEYIRQAALGLHHAHELGMVHRDIKPQNLMIAASSGRGSQSSATHQALLKILDFGLAGFVTETAAELAEKQTSQTGDSVPSHLTQIGAMMGTPDYISPEQARDAHSADIRSDIYSLGCTMYYVLAGQPPHGGSSVMEKVMAHVEREPRPISELRSDIPPALETVLRKMLAKDPAQRFQTPGELAAALSPFVAPPSGGSRHARPPRRVLIAIAATIVALMAVLGGVILVATDRGVVQVQSEVGDVEIRVISGGQEVATIDTKTGSQIRWLRTGDYQIRLASQDNDIQLDTAGFRMTRLGRVIVTARWSSNAAGTLFSAKPTDPLITQDGVTAEDGGWKITATGDRSVRLFEVTPPPLAKGPFFYRAKLKTQDVKGKAYLEMWVRVPSMGESFSKDLPHAVSGTNGWAEYQAPFHLREGEQPDLVKMNLAIEGGGTVWIKDIELRGRTSTSAIASSQPTPELRAQLDLLVRAGKNELSQSEREAMAKEEDGLLELLKIPSSRAMVEMLAGLPKAAHERLLSDGYLKWEYSKLDESRRAQVAGIYEQVLSAAAKMGFAPKGRADLAAKVLNDSEVGFIVLPLEGNTGTVCFFLANRQTAVPMVMPLTTPASGRHPEMKELQLESERVLRGKPVSPPVSSQEPAAAVRELDRSTLGKEEQEILKTAEAYLALLDAGKYDQLMAISSDLAKQTGTTSEDLSRAFEHMRSVSGKLAQRALDRVQVIESFPGLPKARFAAVFFRSDFEHARGLWETVVLNVDTDGKWRVNTYAAKPQPLAFPEPKAKSPAPTPKTSTPLGVNLIEDPSLEKTATGKLPSTWSAWLNDGPEFTCQVVEGGVTGKHCLRISGKGTRGVVFCGNLPLDRTKRYALKGRVKFEGDPTAQGIIKLNYFDAGKWLGVNDLVGVRGTETGWHLFEKTDLAETIPEATVIVPTCHVEGNGTAWFDDLELVAFARDRLPADFDVRLGKNNRASNLLDLDRWVGRWKTTTVYKPSVSTPGERTVAGEAIVWKVLDDRFLLWQWSSEAGNVEFLTLMTFDPYVGGYHLWVFNDRGEVFQRTGAWDPRAQTLAMHLKPPATGVTGVSTDRFLDADRIASTLHIKNPQGQTSHHTSAEWQRRDSAADEDPRFAEGPAAGSSELALLQNMAGEWTLRQTLRPSIWEPDGKTVTFTEKTAWILGGRFLMFRSFDQDHKSTAISLMTYEPEEKSYHFWHFAPDVFGGQWRITWDTSSRGFHWRSIDMPAGWIGTGFNRWIDDDTFDNEVKIKDERGRTLLDSQQAKHRIK